MKCPYCDFEFKVLMSNDAIDDIAPILCEDCLQVSLLIGRTPQRMTDWQLEAVKQSPAWKEVIEPAMKIIKDAKLKAIPEVDRSQRTMTDGSPEAEDHREIDPKTGMQKGYIVLSAEERHRGFVRPVRRTYTHKTCGGDTTMGLSLAETYARDPKFYNGTFCAVCRAHYSLDQFVWTGTDEQVGS